ncbi:hypothetical protein VC83_04168 [Pseudogymnoascus destructans]|uniref:Protein kinase domain-containing protein n=2 Tax=Pseudogymnoascus destructans TaxID=655981 RepID=L8FN05_PSED2|nr:uncharacterized protein VC83_04168 [Pseudogymnoascus destructans]ELR01924.1 hypothetical protein GMDG_05102 [Pseudogymnoascus destructans 20631-21]OAF59325.2 hypothetical protein VC83_04168 [Pseudogymnoascus destructans]
MARTKVRRHAQGKHPQKNRLCSSNQQISRLRPPRQTSTRPPQEAKPITPPQSGGVRGSYECIVDYDHQAFSITWSGSPEYPDLARFPDLKNVSVHSVHQNSRIAAIWRDSTIIDYGAYASIRVIEDGRFPILKLAHQDELSIKLIQHELDVLADLAKLGLPVVEFDQQPIRDNGVICGYRMNKLFKVELSELRSRTDDIKQTLDRLHSAGFSHGDFSPSNIMKDAGGHIILIDFSFAGRIGSEVPSFFPSWVYADGIYGTNSDLEAFGRYAAPI